MRRGFTLIELAVSLGLLSLLVPLVFTFHRGLEADHRRALAQLESARAHQTVREEVARDLWTLRWEDPEALSLTGRGACRRVRYLLSGGVLLRLGEGDCGPDRALARNVREVRRWGGGLQLTFSHRVGPAAFQVALPAQEAP